MPRKVVDFSARSEILRQEPFHAHFWECTPDEYLEFLRDPRRQLTELGIDIPDDCRIETTIENHDWLATSTKGLASSNGTIICNVGGGCRLPATWDQVAAGLASGMGPPPLPVMGPP